MLPLYKLLSLFLRVFSRPLINLTKKYHANNQIKSDFIRRQFYRFGNWFHAFQNKINRSYLKTNSSNIILKPLNQNVAIDKGIQFFYQIIFYSIAIGFPTYEIYRQAVDSKMKDEKLTKRVKLIKNNIDNIEQQVKKARNKIENQNQDILHLNYCIINKYAIYCIRPLFHGLDESLNKIGWKIPNSSIFKL